jgi:hypothetical protein
MMKTIVIVLGEPQNDGSHAMDKIIVTAITEGTLPGGGPHPFPKHTQTELKYADLPAGQKAIIDQLKTQF